LQRFIVKMAGHIRLLGGILLLGFSVLLVHAVPTPHLGAVATADIVTPVALEVIDPTATAALKSVEALKTPAIFRHYPSVTNAMVRQFQTVFEETHSNFLTALQDTFHQTVLEHAAIASPDFGYLVTAFNIKNKQFPIPGFLAMDWAYGKPGTISKDKWLNALLAQMQAPIRPDELPPGFDLGETLRLVPVSRPNERLTLGDVVKRGQFLSQTNLIPLAQVRTLFRRQFTSYEEQPLARAMSEWLQPDCLPDASLTQLARDRAVGRLVVAEHYAAGQVIVAQGSVIDAKIKAALDALSATATTTANGQTLTVTAATVANESTPPNESTETTASHSLTATDPSPKNTSAAAPTVDWAPVMTHRNLEIAGAVVAILIALITGARWVAHRRRGHSVSNVTKDLPWQTPAGLQTELAPQLVRAVQSAFVQELAGHRRHLLQTQHVAATEVIHLVKKMDQLQVAMQERLQTYETQIRDLESELAARTEENRELIQLKIQLIRHQLDVETSRRQVLFN